MASMNVTMSKKLRQADERLSLPSPKSACCLQPGMEFRVLCDDTDSATVLDVLSTAENANNAVLIRFEVYGSECLSCQQRDFDIDSAIVLQNFAQSYLHLATLSEGSQRAQLKRRRCAIDLLELSHSVLATTLSADQDDDDDIILEKLLCVSLIGTNSLAQAYISIPNSSDRRVLECYDRMEELKAAVQYFGFDYTTSNSMLLAPAA